jgi:putative sigma-54 modulation protein
MLKMDINYTARKVNLRDNFKEKAEKKLSKFSKMFNDGAKVFITVTVEKNYQTVEITIKDTSMIFRSESTCKEMNEALDKSIENLGRQIRKYKSRLDKKLHSEALSDFVLSETKEEELESEFELVRTKRFPIGIFGVEEAILQMNLLGHNFFMFRNAETDKISVVYVRKDKTYGLLESEV